MKLRIHAGSIRLRLKQAEVKTLVEGGEVAERCALQPVALDYVLRPVERETQMTARMDGTKLVLSVPSMWLKDWDRDERVGFESVDGELKLLVEKDWKCVNPQDPGENEDCYENPSPACQ